MNITLMIMFRCLRINSFKETIRSPAINEGVKWVEFELENHRAVRSFNLDQRDNSLITLIYHGVYTFKFPVQNFTLNATLIYLIAHSVKIRV